jgi:hypothetical protein
VKFRKKPVVIEAWQFNGEDGTDWPEWLHDYGTTDGAVCYWDANPIPHISIPTLEGRMIANRGDWIICGIKGEVYPCKPDIFEATYELVESPPQPSP